MQRCRDVSADRGVKKSRSWKKREGPQGHPYEPSRTLLSIDASSAVALPVRLHPVEPRRRTVRRVLQRLRAQVGVPLGHLAARMSEDRLDLVQRPPVVHEEARELVAQVVQAQVRQPGLLPDPVPLLGDRGERPAAAAADEQRPLLALVSRGCSGPRSRCRSAARCGASGSSSWSPGS